MVVVVVVVVVVVGGGGVVPRDHAAMVVVGQLVSWCKTFSLTGRLRLGGYGHSVISLVGSIIENKRQAGGGS
jgi:hypothetical protein